MTDLTDRLRDHVIRRGGPTMQNSAWSMMLEAADEIERLRRMEAAINRLNPGDWPSAFSREIAEEVIETIRAAASVA